MTITFCGIPEFLKFGQITDKEDFNIIFGVWKATADSVIPLTGSTQIRMSQLYLVRFTHKSVSSDYVRAMYAIHVTEKNPSLECFNLEDSNLKVVEQKKPNDKVLNKRTIYIPYYCLTAIFNKAAFYEFLIRPNLRKVLKTGYARPLIYLSIFRQPMCQQNLTSNDTLTIMIRDVIKSVVVLDIEEFSLVLPDRAGLMMYGLNDSNKCSAVRIEYRSLITYLRITLKVMKSNTGKYSSHLIVSSTIFKS